MYFRRERNTMKLLNELSHMPFKAGEDLLFCVSSGDQLFTAGRSDTAISLGIPAQTTKFQPWSLAILRGGEIIPLIAHEMEPAAPGRVFCNPVLSSPGVISFMYGNTLWTSTLTESGILYPAAIKSGIFTGFQRGTDIVYAETGELKQSGSVVFESTGDSIIFPFDRIVRVVPHGPEDIIVTGFMGNQFQSILWSPGGLFQRITTGGQDVYKCCLDGDNVIHAKHGSEFEERYLHVDPFELTPNAI
jgi:hypothetical protein